MKLAGLLLLTALVLSAQPDEVWLAAMKESFQPLRDDPRLPRVLLIGDSISIYYTLPVRNLLAGRANVHRVPENGGTTANGVQKLDQWLGHSKWDVIHFNFGLHDIVVRHKEKRNNIPLEDYEQNLRRIVTRLKATGAKLIWAETTPVPEKLQLNADGDPLRREADVQRYNAAAERIMQDEGVSIDRLHALSQPRLADIQRPENVHYTFHGYDVLAAKAAESILAVLPPPANDLFAPLRRLLSSPDPVTWVFAGDSITEGERHTMGGRIYPELFSERVRAEMDRSYDAVIDMGVGGSTIRKLRRDLDRSVLRFRPTVVSIMFGMNDCVAGPPGRAGFREDLTEVLKTLRSHGAIALLHTPNAICFPNAPKRQDLAAYAAVIREVAAGTETPLIDHYAHWLRARTEKQILYWLNDGSIHPNHAGHIEIAHEMFRRLGIFDPASYTCRLFVP